jgi:hypothetical protein
MPSPQSDREFFRPYPKELSMNDTTNPPTENLMPLLPWTTCAMCLASAAVLALFVQLIGV